MTSQTLAAQGVSGFLEATNNQTLLFIYFIYIPQVHPTNIKFRWQKFTAMYLLADLKVTSHTLSQFSRSLS
jgi:hypothetical protein